MTDLADCHKEVLRTLVKLRREATIPEEFSVRSSAYSSREATIASAKDGDPIRLDGLTSLAIESLTRVGYVFSIPRYSRRTTGASEYEYESHRDCYITPAGFHAVDTDFAPIDDILMRRPPVEITRSLADFRADWPDPSRLAFIMMQFGSTKAHEQVHAAIRNALDPHQFVALRADSKQYHDNLWMNILTYVFGCRFGIAVFERIEDNAFNPNVSLEVGYMMGIGKPVCYLKERTLHTLHTDSSVNCTASSICSPAS
jgi:hypothetical protein